MTMDILISIHGKYMDRYKSGDKDVELRLTIPRFLQAHVNKHYGLNGTPEFPGKFRFLMYNTDTHQVESIAYINKKSYAAVMNVPGKKLSMFLNAERKEGEYVLLRYKDWVNPEARQLFQFEFRTGCLDDEFAEYCEKVYASGNGLYLLNFDSIKVLNNPVSLEDLKHKYNITPNIGYVYASEQLTKALHNKEIN